MKPIPFFDPAIVINVHSATHAEHIKPISIDEFTGDANEMVALYENNGELYARKHNGDFIEGTPV